MAKSLPPLTWFRAFEAAARQLNFTAAAEEIGLTQSAVSQHVKSLEQRLGVTLFQRQARGLSLTDAGRQLLPQVDAALRTLATATQAFEAGPARNLLTIASSVSVAQWIIAPDLADFTARHPDLRLRFLSAIWPDDFHSIRADVEIRFGSRQNAGREAELLEPNRLVALKSPDLQGDLADLPLIEAVGTSDGWAAWARQLGTRAEPRLHVDSYGMALHLAAQGNGVALVSELLAGPARRSGRLVPAHPASLPAREGYYLSIDKAAPDAATFRDWLLSRLAPAAEASLDQTARMT